MYVTVGSAVAFLTDTWLRPNRECWELQRTGGVELTFRNTVISTPTWLSLGRREDSDGHNTSLTSGAFSLQQNFDGFLIDF